MSNERVTVTITSDGAGFDKRMTINEVDISHHVSTYQVSGLDHTESGDRLAPKIIIALRPDELNFATVSKSTEVADS